MKLALPIIAVAFAAQASLADPVESMVEWRPACDGATIEVVSDGGKVRSVRALAVHSFVIREWTIHYMNGLAISAEYRERERGKIKEGDQAGEDSGVNPLKKVLTFKAVQGAFSIDDKELSDDLAAILTKAGQEVKEVKAPAPGKNLGKVGYRRLEMGDERAKQVVERLESIKLQDVAIIETGLADALDQLRVKAIGEKKEGVLNHLLRGLPGNQKVTIKAGTISYAKAIDEICGQIGLRWRIEFLELTGPSLVIF